MAQRILHISAEVAPFVKVGGLSQVMYFLPRALNKLGKDVRIFTPKYGVTRLKTPGGRNFKLNQEIMGLAVPVGGDSEESLICNVLSLKARKDDAFVYFLENREYYELRANVFGYKDDHTRFALLTKGCLEYLLQQHKKIKKGEKGVWWPEIIHCHDWHTSYFLDMAKRDPRYRTMLKNVPIVLTVHNFKYQGVKDFRYLREEEKDDGSMPLEPLKSDDLKQQNALLRGLLYADSITTVSPTHAREVLTEEYAEGLLPQLEKVQGKLYGILNGLDMKEFNPATDTVIKRKYSSSTFIHARKENKRDLQREFRLPEDPDAPIISFLGRLASQKGIEFIIEAAPHLLNEWKNAQLIFLGGGEEKYRKSLHALQERYPDNVGLFLFPDFRLPLKMFAGSDLWLVPSMFEPGGIIALEALRFGAVPIVRRTGGLNDIIQDFDPDSGQGNGFSFSDRSAWALYGAMVEAMCVFKQKRTWKKLVQNAMRSVVTWDHAAVKYDKWYAHTIAEKKRELKKQR